MTFDRGSACIRNWRYAGGGQSRSDESTRGLRQIVNPSGVASVAQVVMSPVGGLTDEEDNRCTRPRIRFHLRARGTRPRRFGRTHWTAKSELSELLGQHTAGELSLVARRTVQRAGNQQHQWRD